MSEFHNMMYLGVFLDEMDEQLRYLDEALLMLESKGYQNDIIQRLFRVAHTLKGSSAVMGFKQLNRLTHQMESVLELLRGRRLAITSELLNILFACVDFIKELRQSILSGALEEGDTTELLHRLKELRKTAAESPAPAAEGLPHGEAGAAPDIIFDDIRKEQIQAAIDQGSTAIAVHIQLAAEEPMKYVRAKLVEAKLRETGELVATYPELEAIERDAQFSGTVAYILLTQQSRQDVMACLQEISQIELIHTELITNTNQGSFNEGKEAQKTAAMLPRRFVWM